jgi:hypothetical protein
MNQELERALIDHTNKVWEQALNVGMNDEREQIIDLIEKRCVGYDKIPEELFPGAVWATMEILRVIKGKK